MRLTPDLALFVALISWPVIFLGLARLFSIQIQTKTFLTLGYLSVVVAVTLSVLYAVFVYMPFGGCNDKSVLICSVFSERIIHWYGEWSLVFNTAIAVLVTLLRTTLVRVSTNAT